MPDRKPLSEAIAYAINKTETRQPAWRVLSAMLDQHWLMLPSALEQMAQIALRMNESPEAVAAKIGRPLDNTRSVTVRDGVATVPVIGPIVRYADFFSEVSGMTSVQSLSRDLNEAAENPGVTAIVLEIDSPGGQAAGIADMAGIIAGIDKPVIAYVDAQAASAAYWIAAAADEIVISRAAMLGSVGVIVSANTKKPDGQVQIVSSQSPKKRPDLSTESGRAQVQSIVDDLADVFVADVAKLRGIDVDRVLSWQGDMLVGQKAVDAGLADRLGDYESILAGLSGSTTRSIAMTAKTTSSPEITRESLAAEHPAIADALRAEGRDALANDTDALLALPAVASAITTARAEGATAERERIQAVEAQGKGMPGFDALIDTLKYDGSTTGPEAAVQLIAANGQRVKTAHRAIVDETPAPLPPAAVDADDANASAPVETRCKQRWETDAAVRAEFGTLEAFTAYTRAEESGRVRRISTVGGKG